MNVRFRFERLIADRLFEWTAETACLRCGKRFVVTRGEVLPLLRAGGEVIGVMCPACLAPESRERLAQLRGEEVTR